MVHKFSHGNAPRLVLGICNGMQVLMRLGLLTGGVQEPAIAGGGGGTVLASTSGSGDAAAVAEATEEATSVATLTWNDHGRFEDRWVHLRVDSTPCVFLRGIEQMYLPMAHAQGKFVAASGEVREALAQAGRLALRYAMPGNEPPAPDEVLPFPWNPNGSDANVAGVCDASGRILGLMPHPERHIDPTHHPAWTRRREQPEWGDGFAMFRNAVDYFA
jgi:phosphoribosylformylglycinamidine synthase